MVTEDTLRRNIRKLGTTEFKGCIPYRGGGAGVLAWPDEYSTTGDPVYELDDETRRSAMTALIDAGEDAVPVLIDRYKNLMGGTLPSTEEEKIAHGGMRYGILDCLREIGTPEALSFVEEVSS